MSLTREQVVKAMQIAWDEFVADAGFIPDCFTIHGPRTTRLYADFDIGNFATYVTAWLNRPEPEGERNEALEAVVRALAETYDPAAYEDCQFCDDDEGHAPSCPWRMARELMEGAT
jgi:hypothetical protein